MRTQALFLCVAVLAASSAEARPTRNGFDLSKAIVPMEKILSGGVAKDGIPALLRPKFIKAGQADYMRPEDRVVGVAYNGEARAYPLWILVWHEAVSDTVGGVPVAVTYCPLCGTAMVFDRRVRGRTLTFGISGLLYQSDVLLYDHQTKSLWSQLHAGAVTGDYAGTALKWLSSEIMTWEAWRTAHPDSEVLSDDTGHRRPYRGKPYGSYRSSDELRFPVPIYRRDLRKKSWVLGTIVNGVAKAYPERYWPKQSFTDVIGGVPVTVYRDAASDYVAVLAEDGTLLPSVRAYWFAWQAFYPRTELYTP